MLRFRIDNYDVKFFNSDELIQGTYLIKRNKTLESCYYIEFATFEDFLERIKIHRPDLDWNPEMGLEYDPLNDIFVLFDPCSRYY